MALLRKEEVAVVAVEQPRPENGALLGRGSRFEGKLTFEGTVRIDGEFVGDIVSEGRLVIGEGAQVEGTVTVSTALVSGGLSGTVTTRGPLELKSTARVTADLRVETLMMERGAFFEGTVKMNGGKGGAD